MCPVCRARFRGSIECSRCGADLTIVMSLSAAAWRKRQAARQAILDDDPQRARTLAAQAQSICHTPAGRRLEELSSLVCML
ncbi:MAG TPA: hypothetical protein VGZ73_26980 [Bryobacteraceae bacterium]|jgi:hypothetical protein|nr:hypothetical protein [Bryobacteraceae bacterium]